MYLKRAAITNLRTFASLRWEMVEDRFPGWHVVLGDNGSGKSTFVRSIALGLIPPNQALALRQDWGNWLSIGKTRGSVRLTLDSSPIDKPAGRGRKTERLYLNSGVQIQNGLDNSVTLEELKTNAANSTSRVHPKFHIWSGKPGWFAASYGPFRRFSGGDKDYEKLFYTNPRLASHLSVFNESVALTECLEWLKDLDYKRLSGAPQGNLLEGVKAFINQNGFLPYNAQLTSVSPKGITFTDGNGLEISVEDLSDGYRSILSMTFELIRQIVNIYDTTDIFSEDKTKVTMPGVVLIDEIDAHLHPTWQRRIGFWLTDHFPEIQFIVTTHSPLICQAAERGTIFRLPRPGTDEKAGMINGIERDRLIYGNVLDAYSTGAFGDNVTRSDSSRHKLRRLAELNRQEIYSGLSAEETKEQAQLRAMLPTSSNFIETK